MPAAVATTLLSDDPMTWTEICEQYPETWVYLVDIEWDPRRALDIRSARVVADAPTRKRLARPLRAAGDEGPYFTGLLEVHVAHPQWLR